MDEFITREIDNFHNLKWLDTYLIGHKGFVAGGCFKNIFNKQKVKDIDIFFENQIDFFEAERYYEENEDFRPYYKNNKVTAFKHKNSECHIELVKSVFGTPEEIIKDFDFSITKFALYKEYSEEEPEESIFKLFDEKPKTTKAITYKIIHHKDFFEHMFLKRLVVNKELKFPNSTFERMVRYITYGYMPCKETKMNIISAIKSNTNETDLLSQSLYDGMD